MTQPSEQPRTAAGRALLEEVWAPRHRRYLPTNVARLTEAILAIEAEATPRVRDVEHNPVIIEAAAPDPVASPPEAVRLLRALADELEPAPGERCGEYPELCTACQLMTEARRFLEGAVATPAPLDRYAGLIATMDNAVTQGLTVHVATRATCAEHLQHGDDTATEPLTAAAFGPAVRLLRELVECVNALENRALRSGGEFHVWAEERMLTEARDEARRYLATATEGEPT